MKNTYTITAKSCSAPFTTFSISVNFNQIHRYIQILSVAFRDVTVTNDDTGEIVLSHYESDEMFHPTYSIGSALIGVGQLRNELDAR